MLKVSCRYVVPASCPRRRKQSGAVALSAHPAVNGSQSFEISVQPFVDLIAIRRFDKPVIGRDLGESPSPVVYIHRQSITDMNHLGWQIGLRLPTNFDGKARTDGLKQLGRLLTEAGQRLGQHHEIERLMLPHDPVPACVVVEQVDLADVMQKTADKGHAGANRADLMLHAERRGGDCHLMTVLKQSTGMVMMVLVARLAGEEGSHDAIIKQHGEVESPQGRIR